MSARLAAREHTHAHARTHTRTMHPATATIALLCALALHQPLATHSADAPCPACTCGVTGRGGRVVGGAAAARGELPWLVRVRNAGRPHCGATLVSARHVVTAAHCIYGVEAQNLSVSVGEDGTLWRVAHIVQHPQFAPRSYDYDVAVLRLAEAVPSALLRPACLPPPTDEFSEDQLEGRQATVAGWGRVSEDGPTSDLPRKVTVSVWSERQCLAAGYGARKITARMLCAGLRDGGRDACRGDSGGPLLVDGRQGEMTLIGIVSWGRGCGRPDYPGVYARVDRMLPWLRTQLRGDCFCPPP